MESQGNGKHVVRGDLDGSSIRERLRRRPDRWFRASLIGLLGLLLLAGGIVHAQSTRYVYDANGRVVAVTANNGTSVQYGYNILGHASQVSAPLSSGQLAIFSFMPTHGEAGTQVTLQGQGFDSNAANDTVSFNGAVATVLSASTTQLVTTVPSGATTGPISVAVGGQKATSSTSFVIDNTGVPPTILQVGPQVVSAGDTVTITGTHLDPVAGHTAVQMGGRGITLSASVSDTQLQYVVPVDGTSGYVTIETPYGTSTSSTPITVVPSGISASSVVSSGSAAVDSTGVNLNIGASGQVGTVTFTAPQGGWVSLQASGIITSASSINYTVYAPGNNAIQQGTLSIASPSIHLPHLAGGATYLVLIQPNGGGVQMTLGVETNALLSINAAATVVTTVPGQTKRLLFQATAGQNLAFKVIGTTTNPAGQGVNYTVYSPSGATYGSTTTSGAGVINLGNMPTSGLYQVIVSPGSNVTGSEQVEVALGAAGTLNSSPQNFTTTVTGQNVYLSFTATQGENLELSFNNFQAAGVPYNQFYIYVFNAAGVQVASFFDNQNDMWHLWGLAAGTYSVVVVPYQSVGTISFSAALQDDIVGSSIATNGSVNVSLGAGQVERHTFNANAGDTLVLSASNVSTTPSGSVTIAIYRPDAGVITTNTSAYAAIDMRGSQGTINLPGLPASGTYTVIVSPDRGVASTGQLSVLSGQSGALSANGAMQAYAANVSGENIYLTFNATQGENLELTLSNLQENGVPYNQFNIYVYNAQGVQVASFFDNRSNMWHLWNLAAGAYSIVIVPYGDTGTMSFNVSLQDDLVGSAIATGSTANISLRLGQVERYTFNANAGDTVALNLSGVATTPAGQSVSVLVYRPDAGAITANTPVYASFGATGAQTANLPNLPVSGAYTAIVVPTLGVPANAQLSVLAGVTGTLASSTPSQGYQASASGENIYLSFTATQHENLELVLNNIHLANAGSNAAVQLYVFNAQGNQVANQTCYVSNPGASCLQNLWYLAAGTYSVVLVPQNGGALSVNALLQDDIVGQTLRAGDQTSMYLNAGQVERLSFIANAGDTVQMQVAWLAPSSTNTGVTFFVYRPDAGAITSASSAYTSFHSTSTQTVNVSNVPVSGTYTVIVMPDYGLPASVQLADLSQTMTNPPIYSTATMPTDGSVQPEAASNAGQSVTMTFNANEGDNINLLLTNFSASVNVNVYNPSGSNVGSSSCGNPACGMFLWNLWAGTYSIVVSPQNSSSTVSLNAQLIPETIEPALVPNSPVTATVNAGYVQRYTFNANVGDNVALQLTGVSSGPMTMRVYRPDGGQITPNNYYARLDTYSTQTMNLQNLPVAGTYVVIVWGNYPSSTGQLTLTSSTTTGLATDGAVQSYASNLGGQNVYMTFTAQQGDNLNLLLSNFSASVDVNVYSANGSNVGSNSCSNPACGIFLWNLTAGTYSIVASPHDGSSAISFNAQLIPETIEPALRPNVPVALNITSGYVERYTFNANAGDTVALQLSGVSSGGMVARVYRPDGGVITPNNYYAIFNTSSTQTMNLQNLPVGGTYVVLVLGAWPSSSGQLELLPPLNLSTLSTSGSISNFTSAGVGQPVTATFSAMAGANLELTLSNINISGASTNGVEVIVHDPSGLQVANFYCYAGSPGASCMQPLWNLTAGTYNVAVVPIWGGTISFSAQLQPDITGTSLTPGNSAVVTLQTGQAERVTFSANQGSNIVLQLAGVSTTPANQPLYVDVYRPDVDEIEPINAYASFEASGANSLSLSSLPVGGTYTAVLRTATGIPASGQFSYTTQ